MLSALDPATVMNTQDCVDADLRGLDNGELSRFSRRHSSPDSLRHATPDNVGAVQLFAPAYDPTITYFERANSRQAASISIAAGWIRTR